ncbi:MAG: ferredoxin--nitrite reductase [Sulfurimonas sp. RIFOXYD12_FULL_33_39]|uniref:nitrite/sulfite reductase n=1 Tax=unclassified Sulfurimonas TaxID=2623549 RepID=UPI0008D6277D|nr:MULTISPECIES: nitrite/sulfite reductase [unclassified Sulfurimonas]OHE07707.1 MAG: ferredoxin--nitrite reductase [Sulfurimonas sp. RIFCSPLOWO2_12_FULL_34_6]OHE10728.1 MAG: ferredoxin--nitrite reductase [Sulfurimonas sp. RIFOXYD12_FULL_33_39]OHE13502.1 MAG: ferredoxin--nitrite reductase [Sulfurimonas sp. RIFOXYD2_FULL_34_21]
MAKETKAQRAERIKKEKEPQEVLNDIYRYAQTKKKIDQEDIDRFKWYGLYTQNRNLQDKEDSTLYFMLRVKLMQGKLDIKQLETIAEISKVYARGTAEFTTRQDIQFHFIKIADLPEIFASLQNVGLSTYFAAGDVPRNVVTCALNGIDSEQIYDVNAIVQNVNRYFETDKELSNLPRKYKVGISGCSKHCISHEIQDLSFNARETEDGEVFFDVSVGGGLASNKRIASYIGYVRPVHVLAVVKAVTNIYRVYANRDNRNKARLGHLLDLFGVEKFVEVLHENIDFVIKKSEEPICTPHEKRGHLGIHKSISDEDSYIGCVSKGAKLGADKLFGLVKIMKKYNASSIKASVSQNFVITDVDSKNASKMSDALEEIGILANPSSFRAKKLSCTGVDFCKFAIVETKALADALVEHLEEKFADFNEPISISVNGCPNSCAHPHIVDIGLMGCKVETEDGIRTGFELILGGRLCGEKSSFGKKSGIKFTPDRAKSVVEGIIKEYILSSHRNFHDYALEKTDG